MNLWSRDLNVWYMFPGLLRRHNTMNHPVSDPQSEAKRNDLLLAAFNGAGKGSGTETESEADYWTTGIQVIHDPEQVMKKVEASATERKQIGEAT